MLTLASSFLKMFHIDFAPCDRRPPVLQLTLCGVFATHLFPRSRTGMKDGSVTFPLGSVDVSVGARCRFFVRDGDFAKKEGESMIVHGQPAFLCT